MRIFRRRKPDCVLAVSRGAVLARVNGRVVCAWCPFCCLAACEPCEFADRRKP